MTDDGAAGPGTDTSVLAGRVDGYEISTDPDRLDVARIHHWLSTDAYWSLGRPLDQVRSAIDHSVNYGLYDGSGQQVGYARAVTDLATFAWLCDVYIEPDARGRGLGGWLVGTLTGHLSDFGVYRIILKTRDAHEVYRRYGYELVPDGDRWMVWSAPGTEGDEQFDLLGSAAGDVPDPADGPDDSAAGRDDGHSGTE